MERGRGWGAGAQCPTQREAGRQAERGKASAPIVPAETRHSFLAFETPGPEEPRWLPAY